MPPKKCEKCPEARNCINGRYCIRLGAYVEYLVIPLCERKRK